MSAPDGAPPKPRVHAVILCRDGALIDQTLASLASQTWPQLSVSVVDPGSASVDPRPAARRHGASVIDLPGATTVAAAGRAVLADAGLTADWRLFLAEGLMLEPECVAQLVEGATAMDAGVAGPKLVDAANPEALVEVGLSADRFGVVFTPVEAGEIDHGQHDGTREVLFVSTTCMLVRADLFTTLDGFTENLGDEGADLDLCWRARLADGPVVVVPDARAREPEGIRPPPAPAAVQARNRLRSIIVCSSRLRLIASLVALAAIGVAEIAVLALARRGRDARSVPAAWGWNVRHLPALLRARWHVRHRRRTPDEVIKRLQVGGSTRVREYLESRIEARAERALSAAGTGEHLGEDLRTAASRPQVAFWLITIAVVLIGARAVLAGRLPYAGQVLAAGPDGGLLGSYLSPWRLDRFGAPGGGPAHEALFAVVRLLGLGSVGTGMRLFLIGGYGIGLIGCWRLVGRIEPWPAPAAAVAAYALSPVYLGVAQAGDLGGFWMWALAPFLAGRLLDAHDRRLPFPASVAAGAVTLALATALFPPAPLVHVGMATALVIGSLLAGARRTALLAWGGAVLTAVLAILLLVPASLAVTGIVSESPLSPWYLDWHQLRVALGAGEAIRLQIGGPGGGYAGAAPPLLGLFVLAVARGVRLRWAVRWWAVALAGMTIVFLAGQDVLPAAPRLLAGAVAPAALAVAALVGLAAGTTRRDLPDYPLGWRHLAATALGVLIVVSLAPALGRMVRTGRLGFSGDRFPATSVFLADAAPGRVLWLGQAGALPGDPYPVRGEQGAYVVTTGRPDLGDVLPSPPGAGDAALMDALAIIRDGETQRAGRLLGPFGIRWVVVVPDGAAATVDGPALDPNLIESFGRQLDLAEKRVDPALVVYENTSVLLGPIVLDDPRAGQTARADGSTVNDSLQATELKGVGSPFRSGSGGRFQGAVAAADGAVIVMPQVFDPGWSAFVERQPLEPVEVFGWAQGFEVPAGSRGVVTIERSGRELRLLGVLVQVLLWVIVLVAWRRTRAGTMMPVSLLYVPDEAERVPVPAGTGS